MIPLDVSNAAFEEFTSYVAEKRRQHFAVVRSASDVRNVIEFLQNNSAFQGRHHLFRVFKRCCSVIEIIPSKLPQMQFDLSGSASSLVKFDRCLRLVQSNVLSKEYSHQTPSTNITLDAVRVAIPIAGVFFVSPSYDLWSGMRDPAYTEFIAYICVHLPQRINFWVSDENHYVDCNRENFISQLEQRASTSRDGSQVSSVSQPKKVDAQPVKVVKKGATTSGRSTGWGGSQQGKPKKDDDPTVYRKLNLCCCCSVNFVDLIFSYP